MIYHQKRQSDGKVNRWKYSKCSVHVNWWYYLAPTLVSPSLSDLWAPHPAPLQIIWTIPLKQKNILIPTCSFYISVQTTFPSHILCMSGTSNTLWKTCRQEEREWDKNVSRSQDITFSLLHICMTCFSCGLPWEHCFWPYIFHNILSFWQTAFAKRGPQIPHVTFLRG